MKNQIRLLITNVEKYADPIEAVAEKLIRYVTDRMLCTFEPETITIAPFDSLKNSDGWLGTIVEVKASIKTNRENLS